LSTELERHSVEKEMKGPGGTGGATRLGRIGHQGGEKKKDKENRMGGGGLRKGRGKRSEFSHKGLDHQSLKGKN